MDTAVDNRGELIVIDGKDLIAVHDLLTGVGSFSLAVSDEDILIGELCQEFGVTARTLRFYEQSGLLQPRRRRRLRIYDRRDRQKLYIILKLRDAGFSLQEIAGFIDEGVVLQDGPALVIPKQAAQAKLQEIKSRIETLSQSAAFLRGLLARRVGRTRSICSDRGVNREG